MWECQHSHSLRAFDEMHDYGACRIRVSVRFVTMDDHRLQPADCSLPYGLQRRPGHATMAARYAGLVVIIELGMCLPCMAIRTCKIRHLDATLAIRARNDKSHDFHAADYFHADASTLVRETAERSFGKRGASDFFNHIFNTGRVCKPDDNQPTS